MSSLSRPMRSKTNRAAPTTADTSSGTSLRAPAPAPPLPRLLALAEWLPRWLYATRDRIVSHYLQAITAGGYGSGEPGKLNLNGGRMPGPPHDWRSRAMKHPHNLPPGCGTRSECISGKAVQVQLRSWSVAAQTQGQGCRGAAARACIYCKVCGHCAGTQETAVHEAQLHGAWAAEARRRGIGHIYKQPCSERVQTVAPARGRGCRGAAAGSAGGWGRRRRRARRWRRRPLMPPTSCCWCPAALTPSRSC